MFSRLRSFQEAIGESLEGLDRDAFDRHLAALLPARELPTRAMEFTVAGQDPNLPILPRDSGDEPKN